MSTTQLADVNEQVKKYWSPLFTQELRESLLLGALVNKDYEGEIQREGDTVYVSQVNAATGQNRTVGVDADSFTTEKVSTTRIGIQANKRAVAAYDLVDLVELQSQLDKEDSAIRESLLFGVQKSMNDYLYSLVAPSTATPDHIVKEDSTFDKETMKTIRKLAGQAKWMKNKDWYCLLDPVFYADLLGDTTLASSDFNGGDAQMVAGQVATKRFGFNIFEDNSREANYGLAFHPDFLHLVMQTQVQFKVSDQHANKKFGYIISADIIYGAKLGIDGDKKHIVVNASGS